MFCEIVLMLQGGMMVMGILAKIMQIIIGAKIVKVEVDGRRKNGVQLRIMVFLQIAANHVVVKK